MTFLYLNIVDSTPPTIEFCPDDIITSIEIGDTNRVISWIEPTAIDNSGNATLLTNNHSPGDILEAGRTRVTYIFTDGDRNTASCGFDIVLTAGKGP